MNVGLIIIGDEILSGRRRDRHLPFANQALAAYQLALSWVRILSDERELLTLNLRQSAATEDLVFSFGGIGATPDDLTRACAAEAFERPLERHPDAVALIEARFGANAYPQRIRMAELPRGCGLIPNPYNNIPGFIVERHHFLPGFPMMAHPMLEWVLENHYADRKSSDYCETSIWLKGVQESALIELMEQLCQEHPSVKLFSLPRIEGEQRALELGVKGASAEVTAAMAWLRKRLSERDITLYDDNPYAS